MPRGMHKSNTLRKVFVKAPGNTTKVHYRKRKPGKAKCAKCEAVLPGVPSERPVIMKNLPKSMKRPERPYGGTLCTKCMRKVMVEKARLMEGLK